MSALAKVFVVVNFVMAVFFFGASATLFLTRVDWRNSYETYKRESDSELKRLGENQEQLRASNDALTSEVARWKSDLDNTSAENQRLTENLANLNTELKIRQDQVAQAQVLQTDQTNLLKTEVERNTSLTGQLSQASTSREQALAAMVQADEERNSMKLDLDKAQVELHAMRVSMSEINSSFEELQLRYNYIRERCKGADITVVPPPIDARVVDVDTKMKLVVLSVGRDQKVEKGFRFTVYRDDSFVGKVEVFEVYPDLSGARILFTKEGASVELGDNASTSLN